MKCLQEAVFAEPQQVDRKILFPDSQGHIFAHDFSPRIKRAYNIFRPAFHFEGNNMIVGNNDGSHVQVVRCYRGYYKAG